MTTQQPHMPSPIGIQKFLGGVDYPAKRDDLINVARKHQAPEDVIRLLSELPDEDFNGPDRVMKAYGDLERKH